MAYTKISTPEPIISHDELLPLNSISWEQFESFCVDFVNALHVESAIKVHKYGVKGSKQRGIDMFVDKQDGKHITYQSKEYQSFTKANAGKAIEDTTYKADSYTILVSSLVGTGVRDVCRNNQKWDVLDADDICRKIKSGLSPENQRRLVVNHFGHRWAEKFLGLKSVSPFVSPEYYFERLINKNDLFNQAWDLVGRDEIIKKLDDFVESNKAVFILEGIGGIGKTKILKEFSNKFSEKHPEVKLLFLQNEMAVRPDDIKDLELESYVIVIDDAHRREDVANIINLLKAHPRSIKFILSTRPQGSAPVRSTFIQNNYDPSIIENEKVEKLSLEEARQLAEQVLGSTNKRLIEHLAKQAKDCPLILVVGGKLIAQKNIPLELLEQDDNFTRVVLDRFSDVVLGKIEEGYEPNILKGFINILAIIQPINPSDDTVLDLLASFLSLDKTDVINILDLLETNGVLVRRGRMVRIIPDVLADHIVSRSCLTVSGKPNGFAQKAFNHFEGRCFEEILQNLGELDWRVSRSKGKVNLLEDIWKKIEESIKKGNHYERSEILKKLESVAYYQPEQTLCIIEYVIHNPAIKSEDKKISKLYGFSHKDCLTKLPSLLQKISYHLEYLPRCSDILWELGRNDKRATNQHPEHAMRVLESLAKYDIGKIVQVNKLMLEAIKKWLKNDDVHKYTYSAFDILDPLFEKSSHSDTYEGNKITFHPFMVSKENTAAIRNEALNIVTGYALKSELPVALRAISSLHKALAEPTEHFNGTISEEEHKKWESEQLAALDSLKKVSKNRKEPLVHITIKDDVVWYIKRSRNSGVRDGARKLFESLSKSFETNLTECLMRPDGKEWLADDEKYSYEERQKINLRFQKTTATKFVKEYPKVEMGFKKIEKIFKDLELCTSFYSPGMFLSELAKLYPDYAKKLCALTIKNKNALFRKQVDFLLYGMDDTDHDTSSKIAKKAIETQDEKLLFSMASYYGYRVSVEKINKQDIENIKKLITHKNSTVRRLAIRVIGRIGKNDLNLGMKLMKLAKVGKDEQVAEEYVEQINKAYAIDPDSLNEKEIAMIFSKLTQVDKIGHHWIESFLKYVSEKFPEMFIDFLLKRVKIGEKRKKYTYESFGHSLHKQVSPLKDSPDYEKVLRKIRDAACDYKKDNYAYAKLFKVLTGNFNETTLGVLTESIDSGDKSKIMGIGSLIHHAYHDFIFENPNFVEKILNASKSLGEECYKSVRSNLFWGANSRSKSGTAGQPMPEDIKMRDESDKLMQKYQAGTPTYEFYKDVKEYAEEEIKESMMRDEEMFRD